MKRIESAPNSNLPTHKKKMERSDKKEKKNWTPKISGLLVLLFFVCVDDDSTQLIIASKPPPLALTPRLIYDPNSTHPHAEHLLILSSGYILFFFGFFALLFGF
jgi:hypothetical protein